MNAIGSFTEFIVYDEATKAAIGVGLMVTLITLLLFEHGPLFKRETVSVKTPEFNSEGPNLYLIGFVKLLGTNVPVPLVVHKIPPKLPLSPAVILIGF